MFSPLFMLILLRNLSADCQSEASKDSCFFALLLDFAVLGILSPKKLLIEPMVFQKPLTINYIVLRVKLLLNFLGSIFCCTVQAEIYNITIARYLG